MLSSIQKKDLEIFNIYPCFTEELIEIKKELSVIVCRNDKGQIIGRTIQFELRHDGTIIYPINHYKNVCGGIENLTLHKILFEGTQFTENDGQTTFDPTNQIDPKKPITKKITSAGGDNRLIVE